MPTPWPGDLRRRPPGREADPAHRYPWKSCFVHRERILVRLGFAFSFSLSEARWSESPAGWSMAAMTPSQTECLPSVHSPRGRGCPYRRWPRSPRLALGRWFHRGPHRYDGGPPGRPSGAGQPRRPVMMETRCHQARQGAGKRGDYAAVAWGCSKHPRPAPSGRYALGGSLRFFADGHGPAGPRAKRMSRPPACFAAVARLPDLEISGPGQGTCS